MHKIFRGSRTHDKSNDNETGMKGFCQFCFLLLVVSTSVLNLSCSACLNDADCTNHGEICCPSDLTCSTNERCHRGSCIINSHCPAGKKCVHSKCIPRLKSCYSDKDCFENTTSTRNLKCCHGSCKDVFLCSIPTTKTTLTTRSEFSCISRKDCSEGQKCEGGKCKESSDITLTKAGFLSAAILTGSIFLLILCCCFVRESRYSRQRYAERQRRSRRRRRSRQGRRRSTLPNTSAVQNGAFITDCEGGFTIPPPEYPRDELITSADDDNDANSNPLGEQTSSPPPYCTLSFDLPPSYEEALQTETNRGDLTEVA